MVEVGLVFDERYKRHVPGAGHPERPARLDAIAAGLEWSGLFSRCLRIEPPRASEEQICRVHDPRYVARLKAACEAGQHFIDCTDSGICPDTYEIALLSAGGVIEAAERIGAGKLRRAFCAVRPPGHHAERDRSMGFCFFANVVLAARVLLDKYGLRRVLILDWDVHHGNGTQHLLEADPSVLFISLHGHPDYLYPGTGYAHERGIGPGEGFTLNIPFLPGSGDADYREAFTSQVIPAVERFEPQAIILSAGFDAHADDPLAFIELTDDAFVWMMRQVLELSRRYAEGRILSVLEGGYNLDVLRRCVAEHVQLLSGG